MRFPTLIAAAVVFATTTGAALADDWTALRLRGQVLELVDKHWVPLARGASVPDGTAVRSLASGYVDFVRGTETVSVGPNSEIVIADKAAAGSKPFTTVTEYFGTVSVEADVENVKHFAVDTPYLAAVVKGTRFTVTSGKAGASVTVSRGRVAVSDFVDHSHAIITVGQTATVSAHHHSRKQDLVVTGITQSSTTTAGTSSLTTDGAGMSATTTSEDSNLDGGSSGSDNGNGNGGSNNGQGNGSDNGNSNGSDNGNDSGSGKSDNGNGNQAELILPSEWLSAIA